jgi:hypothetical protein
MGNALTTGPLSVLLGTAPASQNVGRRTEPSDPPS